MVARMDRDLRPLAVAGATAGEEGIDESAACEVD
jgi:hypothetical protein